MKLLKQYEKQLENGLITKNPSQRRAVELLDHIECTLEQFQKNKQSLQHKLKHLFKIPPPRIKGLYLWGNVGVGKTYVMDLFYRYSLAPKWRIHFHAFMAYIQTQLTQHQGKKNPLDLIAKTIAEKYSVICFDEFFVSNIADAMILAKLLDALFTAGITLIASSNVQIDDLYHDGIAREQFLPAIKLLKDHLTELPIHAKSDFRLRQLTQANIYFQPLNQAAETNMHQIFSQLTSGETIHHRPLTLLGRNVVIRARGGTTIWFDFETLCGIPRSQKDFLALVETYHTFLVSHIRLIQPHEDSLITNFIHLIDVLYDAHARIIISAASAPTALYPAGNFLAEYQRTQSRLIEMQSTEYFYGTNNEIKLTQL